MHERIRGEEEASGKGRYWVIDGKESRGQRKITQGMARI